MAVPRRFARGEYDRAIERRQDSLAARASIGIPKFKVAAVLFFPVAVQVHEYVQAAIEFQLRMNIEVGVDLKKPAGFDLM